jgi:multiple sugar transport system permease protein
MRSFLNSIIVGLTSSVISLIIGAMAAYVFARKKIPYGNIIFISILIFRTLPPIALAPPLYRLIQGMGLLNTIRGVILTHLSVTFPIVMFLMYNFFSDFPSELEDAAWIDGCGPLSAFFRIVVPLSAPSMTCCLILAFLFSYNEFLFSYTLLSSNNRITLPAGLALTISQHGINWDLLGSAGTLAVIPSVIFALYVQRYLLRGLWSGALKE